MTTTKRSSYAYSGEGSAIADYFREEKQQPLPTKKEENWGLFDNNNSQHKRILANLRTANIVVKNEKWGEVADMEGWFNQFLKSNKSPVNKPLKKMTSLEVSKIIKALDGVAEWKNSI